MSEQTIRAIEAILKRGNDVEIRRKGDGYICLLYTSPSPRD